MNRPLVFSVLGLAAAGAGTFLPAVKVALYGEVRYWDVATTQAVILLAAGLLGVLCAWRRERIGLAAGTLIMWGALLWPWWSPLMERREKGNVITEAARKVGDAAHDLAQDLAWNFSEMSWGMLGLAVGCLFMAFAALSRSSE